MAMMIAALLSHLSAPAMARPRDCLARLEGSMARGQARPALGCFASNASWLDSAGLHQDRGAAPLGLKRFLRHDRPQVPKTGLAAVTSSSTTFVHGGYSDAGSMHRHFILALEEGRSGWTAARLYAAARPWPVPEPSGRAFADPNDVRAGIEAFNTRFSTGNVAGFLELWHPDAAFVSGIGPFEGQEIRTFFENQSERYLRPRIRVEREHSLDGGQGHLIEGVLEGRCRGSGSAFALPLLLHLRFQDHKVRLAYEAFASINDGCGPFWALPR